MSDPIVPVTHDILLQAIAAVVGATHPMTHAPTDKIGAIEPQLDELDAVEVIMELEGLRTDLYFKDGAEDVLTNPDLTFAEALDKINSFISE